MKGAGCKVQGEQTSFGGKELRGRAGERLVLATRQRRLQQLGANGRTMKDLEYLTRGES